MKQLAKAIAGPAWAGLSRLRQGGWDLMWLHWRNRWSRQPVCAPGGPVVSLTTHGQRLATVHIALESIARGRVKPSRLVLWLGQGVDVESMPGLQRLMRRGVEVLHAQDVGPHTKYWPVLSWPELRHVSWVTADDDICYPEHWLQELVRAHQAHPDDIVAYRAYQITCEEGRLRPYDEWRPCEGIAASPLHFATGVSGVIYPPVMADRLLEAGQAFLSQCPHADDVWLHAVALRAGVQVRQVGVAPVHFPLVPQTQAHSLMAANVAGGGNDAQIARVYEERDRSKLVAAQQAIPGPDGEDVFVSRAWFALLEKHGWVDGGSPMWLPLVDIHGQVVADLPLMGQGAGKLLAFSNFYSPVYGPARRDGVRRTRINWRACAADLGARSDAAVIRLQPMPADAVWWRDLAAGLRAQGYATHAYSCFGNWYLPVPPAITFETYWAERPSRLRNTVERARRKLAQRRAEVEVVANPGPHLEAAIAAYAQVYGGSWKSAEPCPDFMPELMRWAAKLGNLRLGLLRLEGTVVAAQVWLVEPGKAHIYKLAYLPGQEKLSVGSVLTAAMMQHVIDVDAVREVDYLMGDDAYKQDWMTHRRERVGLLALRRRDPRAWPVWGRHIAGRLWRRWCASNQSEIAASKAS